MFARVSIIQGSPEDVDESTRTVREQVLPQARELEGFAGMLLLADRTTGKGIGVTFWETEEALRASEEAADRMRRESTEPAGEVIVAVERYEVAIDERAGSR